jgi:hypothetical protein
LAVRPGLRGVFGWSFYAEPSAERWAGALLGWARRVLGIDVAGGVRPGVRVLALLNAVPLVLVLDGLEVAQEGPEGGRFGRLLDGTLREVLTGACQLDHGGLVVLTSRFPFADLEGFDGDAARMLEVPPFTPDEGATLLGAAGGSWLPNAERRALVDGVDGHALAVAALGAVLAARPPGGDLAGLRAELAAAAGTSARVARVLRFYANRLTEADRYLVAAVALFARPVTPQAALAVAEHPSFEGRLDGWMPPDVEAAARGRLAGLLSWHADGNLAAHPLVREAFRPLALGAAQAAAEATLAGLSGGKIASAEDGLRVVEAVELLITADQWQAADDLYRGRTDAGRAWRDLPAARLGQRAASAFVATPARRKACAKHLNPHRLGSYLNEVGLFAQNCGDLVTAREYIHAAITQRRRLDDPKNVSVNLQNLTECLGRLGDVEAALRAAEQSSAEAARAADRWKTKDAAAFEGSMRAMAGDSRGAEEAFLAADRICHADDPEDAHLYSLLGAWWAEFLARTGRAGQARALTESNHAISTSEGWNADVARCNRLLGRLDLADGDSSRAGDRLSAAAATFRAGDLLVELAETLAALAEWARLAGDLDAADRYVAEALTLASPRSLVPIQAAALTARAHAFADRAAAGDPTYLERGRDAADAARRLAVGHRLPWQEMDVDGRAVRRYPAGRRYPGLGIPLAVSGRDGQGWPRRAAWLALTQRILRSSASSTDPRWRRCAVSCRGTVPNAGSPISRWPTSSSRCTRSPPTPCGTRGARAGCGCGTSAASCGAWWRTTDTAFPAGTWNSRTARIRSTSAATACGSPGTSARPWRLIPAGRRVPGSCCGTRCRTPRGVPMDPFDGTPLRPELRFERAAEGNGSTFGLVNARGVVRSVPAMLGVYEMLAAQR